MSLWLGLLSGTSMDAATAVLCDPEPPGRVVAKQDVPWPESCRVRLAAIQESGSHPHNREEGLERGVADLFAAAAMLALEGRAAEGIGFHGQTVAHQPAEGWTMQVGDPARVAEVTGLPVWSGFREGDLAAGGQGAPLAPLYDLACQRPGDPDTLCVNLGGILNASWIPASGEPAASDVVVCNHLLDSLWRTGGEGPWDEGGRATAHGRAADIRSLPLAGHPFLALRPPKSTHTADWDSSIAQSLAALPAGLEDKMATAARFVATALHEWAAALSAQPDRLLLSGGGSLNEGLLRWIRYLFPDAEVSRDSLGSAREGVLFAWLAREAATDREHLTGPFTGASGPVRLGRVWAP